MICQRCGNGADPVHCVCPPAADSRDTAALPRFTQEDLTWLRAMEYTTLDPFKAARHQAWWQDFLARFAASVPEDS